MVTFFAISQYKITFLLNYLEYIFLRSKFTKLLINTESQQLMVFYTYTLQPIGFT